MIHHVLTAGKGQMPTFSSIPLGWEKRKQEVGFQINGHDEHATGDELVTAVCYPQTNIVWQQKIIRRFANDS